MQTGQLKKAPKPAVNSVNTAVEPPTYSACVSHPQSWLPPTHISAPSDVSCASLSSSSETLSPTPGAAPLTAAAAPSAVLFPRAVSPTTTQSSRTRAKAPLPPRDPSNSRRIPRLSSGSRRPAQTGGMGGCVTKGGAAGMSVPAAAGGEATVKDVSAATSPSTRLPEEASPQLAFPERRRLSLSQSEPVRPDVAGATDSRGHFLINNNTSAGGSGQPASSRRTQSKQHDHPDPDEEGEEEDLNGDDDEEEDDDEELQSESLGGSSSSSAEGNGKNKQADRRVTPAAGRQGQPRAGGSGKQGASAGQQAHQRQCRRLSVSGMPSSMVQDNFENKRQEVKSDTGFFDCSTLFSMGIGYACKKGLKPESPNQDDFFIVRIDDWGLYGVFDGHGPYGHDVSHYVQRELPKLVYNNPHFMSDPKEALKASFITVHQMLENAAAAHRLFDCSLSGCTATVVLHRKDKLYAAHVGDSRCVLGRMDKDGKVDAVDLTIDHKPNNEAEKKRIVASGGQVRRLDGDIPHRVFLKGKLYPGLAMSRAIGDSVGAQAGVICTPDVSEWDVKPGQDLFITLCSDGVWEFLSSVEVANVIYRNGLTNVQASADAIARESWNRWIQEEGNVVDDITCEIIFLNPQHHA